MMCSANLQAGNTSIHNLGLLYHLPVPFSITVYNILTEKNAASSFFLAALISYSFPFRFKPMHPIGEQVIAEEDYRADAPC